MNSREFELWRRRQEGERERIRRLGREATPPELPPKKSSLVLCNSPPDNTSLQGDFQNMSGSSCNFIQEPPRPPLRPPAPSPPPPPSSWNPHSTSTPEQTQRTYHKDSYMAHRRETLGQEGRYRRTASPSGNGSKDMTREEFHQSLLQESSNKNPATDIEAEISNLSLSSSSVWDKSVNSSTNSTIIFTSDALKKIRRQKTGTLTRKLTPPSVAPKPHHHRRISAGNAPPISASSFNVHYNFPPNDNENNLEKCHHNSKSTPSLNHINNDNDVVKPVADEKALKINRDKSSLHEKWKNSLDSLDTVSSMSTSPRTDNPKANPSTTENNNNNNNKNILVDHFHSNSDSGLSSLSGRTSTLSPVSTMSSVSSSSSSGGSSRASLRSASIVSSCTLPGEDIIPENTTITSSTPEEPPKYKFQEEIDCEELSKEFVQSLNNNHSNLIQHLFIPSPNQKSLSDYVHGVLIVDLETGNPPQRRHLSPSILKRKIEELKQGRLSTMAISTSTESTVNPTTKEGEEDNNGNELQRKKDELMNRISQKLNVLRAEQLSLKEEMNLNEDLGRSISETVRNLAKQNEFDKYSLHVEEIDKITSLLLGLSGRLARIENNLLAFSPENTSDEKKILIGKRDKLSEQLDEAKRLKENIDKRSSLVSNFLHRYLNGEQYADYDHFVKMKAKLIMDSREISDKIKLGEEQLHALKNSLFLTTQR